MNKSRSIVLNFLWLSACTFLIWVSLVGLYGSVLSEDAGLSSVRNILVGIFSIMLLFKCGIMLKDFLEGRD